MTSTTVPIFSSPKPFYKVVLTGGPCAGKTTSLAVISDHFRNLGWHVYTCPEANSLLVTGGVSWATLNSEQVFHLQKDVIKTMIHIETIFEDLARRRSDNKPVLILCDRGVMDASAYVDKEQFQQILKELNIENCFEVKDQRYDMVIHLVSAALGAEEHYTLENNVARTESATEAIDVDKRLIQAWTGHPNIVCINNRTQFKDKVIRAVQAICKRVDAPIIGNSTVKRKFLVTALDEEKMSKTFYEDAECEYTYLQDGDGVQQRLRKRGKDKLFIYTQIIRSKGQSGQYERYTESFRNISAREYETLSTMALATHTTVQIIKRSFVYKSQYFSLAIFKHPFPNLMLLEMYEEPNIPVELPEFLTVDREVTADPAYSMFNLGLLNRNTDAKSSI